MSGHRSASAGADEQLGQGPVVGFAALEVVVDLVESQVVGFDALDRQRCDREARVACE
jgi:hypothetical protein